MSSHLEKIHSDKSDFSRLSRIYGTYTQDQAGPHLVVFGGIHGNEPSGVQALERVFTFLQQHHPAINGTLTGVNGNLAALKQGVRYCNEDLNRLFLENRIQSATRRGSQTVEEQELLELVAVVEKLEADATDKPFFVDCHTTSSRSIPYISLNEGFSDSYNFVKDMPATTVIGAEKEIKGCLAEWLNRRGWHGFTFEAGQHDEAVTVDHQEAMIWKALLNAGCLTADATPKIAWARAILSRYGEKIRQFFNVTGSYRIQSNELFKMEPGFVNLQKIEKGQLLATSSGQPVYAEEDAYILMPLYQAKGEFGFFIAERISDEESSDGYRQSEKAIR